MTELDQQRDLLARLRRAYENGVLTIADLRARAEPVMKQLMPQAAAAVCECEHVDHFESTHVHPYGAVLTGTVDVGTPRGRFNVCITCRDTCLAFLKTEPQSC